MRAKSGATAEQVWPSRHDARDIEYVEAAHDEAGLEAAVPSGH